MFLTLGAGVQLISASYGVAPACSTCSTKWACSPWGIFLTQPSISAKFTACQTHDTSPTAINRLLFLFVFESFSNESLHKRHSVRLSVKFWQPNDCTFLIARWPSSVDTSSIDSVLLSPIAFSRLYMTKYCWLNTIDGSLEQNLNSFLLEPFLVHLLELFNYALIINRFRSVLRHLKCFSFSNSLLATLSKSIWLGLPLGPLELLGSLGLWEPLKLFKSL